MVPILEDGRLQQILLRGQRRVLELIAAGAPNERVLECLCLLIDDSFPASTSSILLLSEDGAHLRHGAAPRLPPAYCKSIDGIATGPSVGSCGTAAFTRKTVIVEDISRSPLWRGFEELASTFQLGACASSPIFAGSDGRLLGTFATYHASPGPFDPDEIRLLGALSDLAAVTILNRAREAELSDSQTRLARAAAVTGVMESQVSADGTFLRVTPALAVLVGRTESEMMSLRLSELLAPDDLEADHEQYIRLARGEIDSLSLESRLVRKDGTFVWVSIHALHVPPGPEGRATHMVIYFSEISEKKDAEDTLRGSQKMESLGLLAPGVAHDFNNLLTAIMCNASLAESHLARDSEAFTSLQSIEVTARRAAELSRQLLSYAGAARAQKRALDVNHLTEEIVQILASSFLRQIEVVYELEASLPFVLGDPSQVHQVLLNLVINAAQAMGGKSGTITLTTSVEELDSGQIRARFPGQPMAPGEYASIAVRDSGDGMPADVIAHIFEPFFTTKPNGRGLGLAVSLGILREHRAGVEVSSVVSGEGRGTCFRLLFPVARSQAVLPKSRRPEALWPVTRGSVLLVDDDETVRGAVARLFRERGFLVEEAGDGQEAMLALARRRGAYSLVIFDSASRRVGEGDALQIIAERWPELRVIVTAGGGSSLLNMPRSSRVVSKPYNLIELSRVVFGESETMAASA